MKEIILIAEDDSDIRDLLKIYLESEGYRVVACENGTDALLEVNKGNINMAILDVMMPGLNGLELTRAIREQSDIPILIVSAKGQDNDKILGLNIGADDYVSKPFNPLEVVARVKAMLRRAGKSKNGVILVNNLCLDTVACTLTKYGKPVFLTPTEYRLLSVLMREPGRIFTKVQLYEAINGEYFESDDNTMMVHIFRLREKIEDDPKSPEYIKTIRGLGYKFEKK